MVFLDGCYFRVLWVVARVFLSGCYTRVLLGCSGWLIGCC